MSGLLIVNPQASGVTDALVEQVRDALPARSRSCRTERGGQAGEIAQAYEGTSTRSTSSRATEPTTRSLNGVDGDIPLGFVPGGGTSVLPRALGTPARSRSERRGSARGRTTRTIGLGRVNGRRFAFNAGIGLDAELVRRIDSSGRREDGRRPGRLAFVREALGLALVAPRSLPGRPGGGGRTAGRRSRSSRTAIRTPMPGGSASGSRAARRSTSGIDLVAPSGVRARDLPRLGLDAASRGAAAAG